MVIPLINTAVTIGLGVAFIVLLILWIISLVMMFKRSPEVPEPTA
jgi:hypothetical protein